MWCYGLLVAFYCEVAAPTPPVSSYCQLYKPVHWSAADTRLTKEQADTNNRIFKATCRKH